MKLPFLENQNAQALCLMLQEQGYQAWFVGGCVRNALLNEPVSDLDVSTDALPETVSRLAKVSGFKAIPTGIAHGTITVVIGGEPFEVTTFRRDVETDGRRAVVAFSDNMIDDARRRDFTMNALYMDRDGALADPLGGLSDLNGRRVRFIEDADARVQEDFLRILRFFRFHAWYGDHEEGLDPDGLAACAAHVEGLAGLSKERLGAEMLKLLSAPDPSTALSAMANCGALAQVLPGASATYLNVLVHLEDGAVPDPILRLSVVGGDAPSENLRLSKKQAAQLAQLSSYDGNHLKAGYLHGADISYKMLMREAALVGTEIDPNKVKEANFASQQEFPVRAKDFADQFQGQALGKALASAQDRWIASNFTLTRSQLVGE